MEKAKRLHRIEFLDCRDPNAFGFVDPAQVVRATHIIPDFESGFTTSLLPKESVGRQYKGPILEGGHVLEHDDYWFYFVNM